MKWIGAMCIIAGCFGWGFLITLQYQKKMKFLNNLILVLDYMQCELEYRMLPLPQLCRSAAEQTVGTLSRMLQLLCEEIETQIAPNVYLCMSVVLDKFPYLDETLRQLMIVLARNLGNFDMPGQMQGIAYVRQQSTMLLETLMVNKDSRLRNYQTLGLCAGAALVILFV